MGAINHKFLMYKTAEIENIANLSVGLADHLIQGRIEFQFEVRFHQL